jgi:hypothetical protein
MKAKILLTASLLALTIVGRGVFETDAGNAATEDKLAASIPVAVTKALQRPTFNESGGEFRLKLTLKRQGDRWNVVKSDVVTDGELHQPGHLTAFNAGFSEVNPNQWSMLMSPVREYLYYRKQAVVNGDVSQLWARYPELKQSAVPDQGINLEPAVIDSYQSFQPIDGNIEPEKYERLKAKVSGDQAEVIIHGMELYLYRK